MRVGIIAVHHESNTVLPSPTTIDHFRADTLLTGEPIRQQFAAAHHEIGGFFAGLAEEKLDAVPIFAARAIPSGVITAETASALVDRLLDELDRHLPFDGLLIAAPGAAVSEIERDFDGFWLSRLRHRVGANCPIVCTLDLHANLSQGIVKACDAMIAYRTNPHLDQRERGIEAAHLIARTLRGEVKPNQAAAFPPVAINIERQSTDTSPCLELIALADEMRRRPGVLSISAILGFPYADVIEMGSSFVAVTDNDPLLAQSLADELAAYVIHRRESFDAQFISIDQALHEASHSPGPVCLLDIGDNVGGGSPGDGTALAHAIRSRGQRRAFVCINDPQSANDARSAGAGSMAHLSIGGKIDTRKGRRLMRTFASAAFTMANSTNRSLATAARRITTWAHAPSSKSPQA